ncbi:MAG: hypothetical protein J6Q12_04025 [Bacteroidales bacterium]|nr:hypothetical protein [Bacteroidales bacterium]
MKKFGLIGHPIAHSLSPALFKAGYDGRYPYDLIETSDFEEAYQRFMDEYDGINVTAPFKELAYAKADIISEECRLIGATNLLVKTAEGVAAYNSDFRGLLYWLNTYSQTATTTVLIVGLGGAGKAAAVAAWKAGMEVILMNRDKSKSEDMAVRLGSRTQVRPLSEFAECFKEADIIIYNLPVRLPEIDSICSDASDTRKILLEANYKNPSFDQQTLDKLKGQGLDIEYHTGRSWLLLQALTGYELFTGEKPDLSKMTEQI